MCPPSQVRVGELHLFVKSVEQKDGESWLAQLKAVIGRLGAARVGGEAKAGAALAGSALSPAVQSAAAKSAVRRASANG